MRIPRWKTGLLFSVLSLTFLLAAARAGAGEQANAFADPDDLVILDESPAIPGAAPAPVLTPEAAVQSAFPVFYGELPVTSSPEPTLPITPAAPPAVTPPSAVATIIPAPVAPAGLVAEATGDIATAPVATVVPVTPAAPVGDGMALGEPVPLPPPAELLGDMQGAAALPAAQAAAAPVPSISATETPAPPLPDLPSLPNASAQPAMSATPIGGVYSPPAPPPSLEQVRADFAALKNYCETDSLGSAAEIYANMPGFGGDEEMNRLRADAANLLILGLSRSGNLMAARRIYDSVPTEMPGFDARLAKARAVINLATYYIRAQQYNDAFAVLMDIGNIQNRSALNNDLFRLMARMIPYLDNAEETDKAQRIYDLLLSEVKSPGTAALFAENVRASLLTYYFRYVDNSDSPVHRRKRLDFLEHIFNSLDTVVDNEDVRALKYTLGMGLADRYAGDPDRAEQFRVEL